MWPMFMIPSFDKQHSAFSNTAHNLKTKTDLKYIYIISSYCEVNTLRLD